MDLVNIITKADSIILGNGSKIKKRGKESIFTPIAQDMKESSKITGKMGKGKSLKIMVIIIRDNIIRIKKTNKDTTTTCNRTKSLSSSSIRENKLLMPK